MITYRQFFSLCPHMAERALWDLYYQGTNLIHESSTLMT